MKEYIVNICQKELNRNVLFQVLQDRYNCLLKDKMKRSASNHDNIQTKKRTAYGTLNSFKEDTLSIIQRKQEKRKNTNEMEKRRYCLDSRKQDNKRVYYHATKRLKQNNFKICIKKNIRYVSTIKSNKNIRSNKLKI